MYSNGNEAYCGFKSKFEGTLNAITAPIDKINDVTVRTCYNSLVKNPVSSQNEKFMAGTKFSDYLSLKHYKKANKKKTFQPFMLGLLASKF